MGRLKCDQIKQYSLLPHLPLKMMLALEVGKKLLKYNYLALYCKSKSVTQFVDGLCRDTLEQRSSPIKLRYLC